MALTYKKPNYENVGGKSYQYLVPIKPEEMRSGYYELKLVKFGLNDDQDKFAAEFKILETDLNLRGTASFILDSNNDFPEAYFWTPLAQIRLALKGLECTKERVKKATKRAYKGVKISPDEGGGDQYILGLYEDLIGGYCRLELALYDNKKGKPSLRQTWLPSQEPDESE